MSYGESEDDESLVLNGADQAVVADAVAPLSLAVRRECFSMRAGIFAVHEIFHDPAADDAAHHVA